MESSKKIAILDKDGTLTETISGDTFVNDPQDQKLLPGVAERLLEMDANGWEFAIVSNQGGVAARHKTLVSAMIEMEFCLSLLPVKVREAFICPDYEGMRCFVFDGEVSATVIEASRADWHPVIELTTEMMSVFNIDLQLMELSRKRLSGKCRKSDKQDGAGMLRVAMRGGCDEAVMIGDRPEDAASAKYAGVAFIDAATWRQG